MLPQWVIEKKRDGHELSDEEIRWFINGYTRGDIPDYQMSAMAMAIYLRGMTPREIAILTDAMMRSGDLVDTSSITKPKVDKHSTGGIGDKVSLILAPLVACFDAVVPMISGRGLGITGGTLDKLESIPGYRTDLSEKSFIDVLQRCGCSIIGQTSRLAPADKKLYALRDVTATVPSIALITASIMCKKLAEGIDALVLDVKCGRGAFMKNQDDARALAMSMVKVGREMGKSMAALLTDMNQPLGRTAGNALEVIESIETLHGRGPKDLEELTIAFAVQMLLLTKPGAPPEAIEAECRKKLQDGNAIAKFRQMVELHGGDLRTIDRPALLPQAKTKHQILSIASGFVADVNAEAIGRAVVILGGGRAKTDDKVDFAVGISGIVKIGEAIQHGQPTMTVHANDAARLDEALKLLDGAVTISPHAVTPPPLILETIT